MPLFTQLTKLVGVYIGVEDGDVLLLRKLDPVILDHTAIDAHVGALHRDGRLGTNRLDDEMVIAVWAILICLFELLRIFSEALFALFASKGQLEFLQERVVLLFLMTFDAVKPFPAYRESVSVRATMVGRRG